MIITLKEGNAYVNGEDFSGVIIDLDRCHTDVGSYTKTSILMVLDHKTMDDAKRLQIIRQIVEA